MLTVSHAKGSGCRGDQPQDHDVRRLPPHRAERDEHAAEERDHAQCPTLRIDLIAVGERDFHLRVGHAKTGEGDDLLAGRDGDAPRSAASASVGL